MGKRKRRKAEPLPESREELLAQLERLSGRKFHTIGDVRDFVALLDVEKTGAEERSANTWRTVKDTTLLLLLILAFVQFYFTDILIQIASLREMMFFVPAREVHSALLLTGLG